MVVDNVLLSCRLY